MEAADALAAQSKRIAELESQLAEANKPPTGNAPCARLCEHMAFTIQHRQDAERIAALESQISGLIRMNADDVATALKETP